ncbi:hypothetical protein C0J52_08595 [Blattella germanica]|nr:hypothetical protein C0J52_08595 [Blattella germanica]
MSLEIEIFSLNYLQSLIPDWKVLSFTVIIVCLYVIYRYVTKNDDYFKKRNVPYLKPTFYIGNVLPVLTKKRSTTEHIIWLYNQFEGHKIAGTFQFMLPMYLVRDPDLVKHITVKDFEHFADLPIFIPEDVEPILTKNLQALKGQRWKEMRSILSPAFTSSKLKIIFKLISEIADQLTSHIEEELKKQQTSIEQKPRTDPVDVYVVDVKDLYTKYTNDVIATSAFGIELNSLQNPDNEFYKMGKSFVTFSVSRFIVFIGYSLFPKIMKFLRFRMIPKHMTDFFRTLVKESIQTQTLRLYAPAPQIGRKCIKDYPVPNSELVIEKDSIIVISTGGLHHDPKYFPDPEVFNPDRFNDDNKHNIKPFTYMPFGSGPRQCIANRFALMETKAALVHLLKCFELQTTSKTKLPLQISKSFQFSFEGGFSVGFKLRKENS